MFARAGQRPSRRGVYQRMMELSGGALSGGASRASRSSTSTGASNTNHKRTRLAPVGAAALVVVPALVVVRAVGAARRDRPTARKNRPRERDRRGRTVRRGVGHGYRIGRAGGGA